MPAVRAGCRSHYDGEERAGEILFPCESAVGLEMLYKGWRLLACLLA